MMIPNEYVIQLEKELSKYKQWVIELQSGMYINCVYCGHCYGLTTEISPTKAEVLTEHIEKCPEHPMSQLKLEYENLLTMIKEYQSNLLNNEDTIGENPIRPNWAMQASLLFNQILDKYEIEI